MIIWIYTGVVGVRAVVSPAGIRLEDVHEMNTMIVVWIRQLQTLIITRLAAFEMCIVAVIERCLGCDGRVFYARKQLHYDALSAKNFFAWKDFGIDECPTSINCTVNDHNIRWTFETSHQALILTFQDFVFHAAAHFRTFGTTTDAGNRVSFLRCTFERDLDMFVGDNCAVTGVGSMVKENLSVDVLGTRASCTGFLTLGQRGRFRVRDASSGRISVRIQCPAAGKYKFERADELGQILVAYSDNSLAMKWEYLIQSREETWKFVDGRLQTTKTKMPIGKWLRGSTAIATTAAAVDSRDVLSAGPPSLQHQNLQVPCNDSADVSNMSVSTDALCSAPASDFGICAICQILHVEVVLEPCRMACLCVSCAELSLHHHNQSAATNTSVNSASIFTCPMCRVPVTGYERIYIT